MAPPKLSRDEALASLKRRFDAKWQINPETGCWEWQGALHSSHGYGHIWSPIIGHCDHAHRVSHLLYKGEIPDGMHIDHLCKNRRCVNPDHIEAVTQAENNRRTFPGERQKAKTHCPQGHPYDETNTLHLKGNRRDCRACCNDRARRRRLREKLQRQDNAMVLS